MPKLCCVYNFAPLYREGIFRLIDKEWNCDWVFGNNTTDIKGLPRESLKNILHVDNIFIMGSICWQKGTSGLIRSKEYTQFLMLGEPMCLSTWWILIQRRLFYRKKKVYLWSHGWYGREGFAKKWIKRIFFGLSDHVFTYGDYAKSVAISQGFNGEKITPIHNSLNYVEQVKLRNQLTPTNIYKKQFLNEAPTLSFIGRLTKVKRLDMVLDAIKLLKDRGQQYNLVLIGEGEESEYLRQKAHQIGISDNIWFYGSCYDEKQNASLIYNSDLCVAPGNVGLTAMHSMVFGTPVLTHDCKTWQMPEFEAIKPGLTGDFFKQGSVESLANTIQSWFETHPNREIVRQACYAEIDTNWTPQFQLNVLKSVIG